MSMYKDTVVVDRFINDPDYVLDQVQKDGDAVQIVGKDMPIMTVLTKEYYDKMLRKVLPIVYLGVLERFKIT